MANPPSISRPSVGLLLLEGRALLELGAAAVAYPVLKRAPRGDGHPVLVFPGFMASDFSTRVLRSFLRDRGYSAHGWKLGRNTGPSPELVTKLGERFAELFQRHTRKISLIGWSLGGIYARELARRFPDGIRQVITLGSPFRDVDATNVPAALRRRAPRPDDTDVSEQLRQPIPVPMTSIYSRSDGIAPWQSCVSDAGDMAENIEVESSHLGIGHHPIVLLTIADRLAQPDGEWKKFKAPPGWRWPFVPRVADW